MEKHLLKLCLIGGYVFSAFMIWYSITQNIKNEKEEREIERLKKLLNEVDNVIQS